MRLYKEAFEGYSLSEFCFIKFHVLLHYPHFLREFGSLIPMCGYWWESSIKFYLKVPYQVVNRSRVGLMERLQRTMLLRHIIFRNLGFYADPAVQSQLLYDPGQYASSFLHDIFRQHGGQHGGEWRGMRDADGRLMYDAPLASLTTLLGRRLHRTDQESTGVVHELPARHRTYTVKGSTLVMSGDGKAWGRLPPHMEGMGVEEVMPDWVRAQVYIV